MILEQDKYKIVSLIPLEEGPNFFAGEGIQSSLALTGIEARDRPNKKLLLEHLQYSLLLRCVWHNANKLYLPSADMHTFEVFRRSIYAEDESPSKTLTMDLNLRDGSDPCDENFKSMLKDD